MTTTGATVLSSLPGIICFEGSLRGPAPVEKGPLAGPWAALVIQVVHASDDKTPNARERAVTILIV